MQILVKKEEDVIVKKEIKEEPEETSEEKKKEKKVKKDKKENKKTKKNKQTAGPMHFTANNEPRALDVLGDLDPSIFNEVSKCFPFESLDLSSLFVSLKSLRRKKIYMYILISEFIYVIYILYRIILYIIILEIYRYINFSYISLVQGEDASGEKSIKSFG